MEKSIPENSGKQCAFNPFHMDEVTCRRHIRSYKRSWGNFKSLSGRIWVGSCLITKPFQIRTWASTGWASTGLIKPNSLRYQMPMILIVCIISFLYNKSPSHTIRKCRQTYLKAQSVFGINLERGRIWQENNPASTLCFRYISDQEVDSPWALLTLCLIDKVPQRTS